jgi:hypothetical protein
MDDAINGQIIPALGQWQGTIVIVASLAVASLLGQACRLLRPQGLEHRAAERRARRDH